jgi:cyclopropane-fatty-acyl-phospholipid synthase
MAGTLTVEAGTLYDFLSIVMEAVDRAPRSWLSPLWNGFDYPFRRLQQFNPAGRSKRNVAHHYDLSETFYRTFLDTDMQYSCAYFGEGVGTLEDAQAHKKRHLAAKLGLEPGMRVLDIGSGWGGLALYLAKEAGVDVTGLTLSVEQHRVASERARATGLADRVRFHLKDYRAEQGIYDRIVSVGMFEHVGVGYYRTFFEKVFDLLAPSGVAVVHSIGRREGPGTTTPWIRKYIFPGGYIPALSEVLPAVERANFWVTDIEILRLHYAKTLAEWRRRFMAAQSEAVRRYDEEFARMWEFYLAGSEASFRVQGMMNFQIQLAKSVEVVPPVRDYIRAWEEDHPVSEVPRIPAKAVA